MNDPQVTMRKIFDLQACVPKGWSDDQAKAFVDLDTPSGTEKGWVMLREGHKYLGGDPERVPCQERPDFVHVRFEC